MAMHDEFEDDEELECVEDYEDGEIGCVRFVQAHGVDRTYRLLISVEPFESRSEVPIQGNRLKIIGVAE